MRFPVPLDRFVTENILVESFEEGELLTEWVAHATTEDAKKMAQAGLDVVWKMLFIDNFLHAGECGSGC